MCGAWPSVAPGFTVTNSNRPSASVGHDFSTTPEGLEQVRRNILKAGIVGRLVANDFSGAIISAELLEVDPTTGQRLDFRHHVAADAMEAHVGQAFAHAREDLGDEPAHRVHVRRMAETTDEHQVAALRERLSRPGELVQVGQHFDPGLRRIARQQFAFGFADHHGDVAAGDHAQFRRARTDCRALQGGIVGELRGALFAQVMQVDGVEDDPRLRSVLAQQRQEFAGDVMPAQQHAVETCAMLLQPSRRALREWRVPGLDAQLLQVLGVTTRMFAVGGQEHDVQALFAQQPHQVHQPQRTRIVVRHRCQRIDHQHLALAAVQHGRRGHGAGFGV